MSLLGFDAVGKLALGQNPISSALPAIFGGSFHIWSPAPRPRNFSKDWVAFADNFSVNSPKYTQPFSPFSLGMHARNSARDWIAFSGNFFVETRVQFIFTPFSQPPRPPHFSKDWIAYSGSEQTEDFPTFGIDFMPFAIGRAAKLWTRFGQQPQWWTDYFAAPFIPSGRDTHDGGHLRRWPHPRRHPSVYSQEYYDQLRKKIELTEEEEQLLEEIAQIVPNLLIPINRLIPGLTLPSLNQLPPFRPMPTLTMNPPEFHMTTPEEMAADDEMIIRMLLEE